MWQHVWKFVTLFSRFLDAKNGPVFWHEKSACQYLLNNVTNIFESCLTIYTLTKKFGTSK